MNKISSATSIGDPKLNGLDHLRALAISFVFIYHYGILFNGPDWIKSIGKFGWTGVDLFFVLSGYLISSHLFAELDRSGGISLKRFFIKRSFRIIPAYYFVVALYFLFPAIREREAPAPLWKYLSFTHNFGLNLSKYRTFSHSWSLCIEEQFYLLFPLILILIFSLRLKKSYWLLIGFFMLGFLLRWYSFENLVVHSNENSALGITWHMWVYYPTYNRLDGLLCGVGIAALFQYRPSFRMLAEKFGNWIFAGGLLVLVCAYFLCIEEWSFEATLFGFPVVSLGYGLLVLGAITPSSFLFKIKSGFSTTLATLSYSMYLVHKFVVHLTQKGFGSLGVEKRSTLMFFICLASTLLAAWIVNLVIEKPFLTLRQRILQKKIVSEKIMQ